MIFFTAKTDKNGLMDNASAATRSSAFVLVIISLIMVLGCTQSTAERKAKYLQRGQDYLAQRDFEKAMVEFKNVLQIDPKDPLVYYNIGVWEEKQGRYRKAFGYYSKALEYDPTLVDAKLKLARLYLPFDIEKSKELTTEVLNVDPKNEQGIINAALIEFKNGNSAGAIENLSGLLKANSTNTEAALSLAMIYSEVGAVDKSRNVLDQATGQKPDDIIARRAYVAFCLKSKDDQCVARQLNKIAEIDPENLKNWAVLSAFLADRGEKERAETVLKDLIKKKPDDENRYLLLASFLKKHRSNNAAIDLLKQMAEDRPEFDGIKFQLAERLLETGKTNESEKVYQQITDAHRLDPVGLAAKNGLAKLRFKAQKFDKALALLEEVLEENPKDNTALLMKGQILLTQGNGNRAIGVIRQLLKDQPNNAGIHQLLAAALVKTGAINAAREHMRQAVELEPNNTKHRIRYAKLLAQAKSYDPALDQVNKALDSIKEPSNSLEALKLKSHLLALKGDGEGLEMTLKEIMTKHPEVDDANISLGRFYLSKKQFQDAEALFSQILAKQPDSIRALAGLAAGYQAKGEIDKAERILIRYLDRNSKSIIPRFMLGKLYFAEARYDDAIRELKIALRAKPDTPMAMLLILNAYTKLGLPQDTITYLQETIAEFPDHPIAFAFLGEAYGKQGEFDKAVDALRNAKKINPKWAYIHQLLGAVYLSRNQPEKAIESYRAGVEALPNNVALIMSLGEVYSKAGKIDKAISIFEEALALEPNNPMVKNNLAALLSYRDDDESLRRAYQFAMDIKDIDQPIYQDTVGWVYYQHGDIDKAVLILEKAAENAKDAAIVQYHLGMAYYQKGNGGMAKRYLDSAIRLNQDFEGIAEAKKVYSRLLTAEDDGSVTVPNGAGIGAS